MKTYKGKIESLLDNQILVFGSNPLGFNGNPSKNTGGAALVAYNIAGVKQGERMDNRLSDSGKAWGLTTVTRPGAKRSKSVEEIINGIRKLYSYAKLATHKEFLVAYRGKSGYNLNGYTNAELGKMFAYLDIPDNMVFEEEFSNLLITYKYEIL